jgi:hypothetical protein
MISHATSAMPEFCGLGAGVSVWKWVGLVVTLAVYGLFLWIAPGQTWHEQHRFRRRWRSLRCPPPF